MRGNKKSVMNRVLSIILAVLMLVTSVPVDVHAAEPSLKVTNGKGEETDTFYVGEPIYVTASSDINDDWVGLLAEGATSGSWYWYYVNGTYEHSGYKYSWTSGETYNIYETVYWTSHNNNGVPNDLRPGTYDITLVESGITKKVTIKAQDENAPAVKLSVSDSEIDLGETITISTVSYNAAAWTGIYKGDVTSFDTSYDWRYSTGVNGSNSGWDWNPTEAGKYTIALFEDGSYNATERVVVNVKTAAEETGRETVSATCEKDGKIIILYADGTTETITADEYNSLKALGHNYGEFIYDGAEERTHTKTCANPETTCEKHSVTEKCTWDDGIIKSEPTETENGVKVFTCSVCKGTYEEEISAKVPVLTKVITPATCEKAGVLRNYYDQMDGSDYIDTLIKEFGHDYDADDDGNDDWKNIEDTSTHSKTCSVCVAEGGCSDCKNAIVKESCTYSGTPVINYASNTITYTCTVCGGTKIDHIISTDKTEYKFGEEIKVTTNFNGNKAWVGLYKKGETYNPTAGGAYSIKWYYIENGIKTVDFYSYSEYSQGSDPNNRVSDGDFKAGQYSLVLLNNDNYDYVTSVDIKITKEETGRKINEPTCEAAGETVISYSDGSTEIVPHAKLGHDYDVNNDGKDDWVYNGSENKTHKKNCQNAESKCNAAVRSVTENCTFGEAEITKKAEGTEAGEKTYTCSVCGGTYTEEYFDKVVEKTEIVKEATCQEEGTLRTYYSDKTYSDSVINKLACEFGEWTHVENTKTHERVCTKDGTEKGHKETESCAYSFTSKTNGKLTYTCEICKNSYSDVILSTDKTSYKFGEPIMVTTDYATSGDTWVGIFRKGDVPGTPFQEAFYWNYLKDLSSTFNMIDPVNKPGNLSQQRWDQYVAGEYTIILFADGGYTVATSVDITITKEETDRKITNPTCESDGLIVISYSDGTTETITVEEDPSLKKTGHAYPKNWTFDKEHKKHTKVCGNDTQHVLSENCTFDEVIIKEPSNTELGEKKFTCSVCNGSYTEPYTDKEITGEEIIEPATCDKNGTKRYYYEGGYFDVIIDMLGHKYGEWEHVEGTKTHSKICEHDSTHVVTDDCKYGTPVVEGKTVIYTCEECSGEYKTSVLTSDKVVYDMDDQILVTAFCENPGSWVGLYKKGEKYGEGAGTIFSMRWYYVKDDGIDRNGATIDISSSAYIGDRQDPIVAGDYYVVLFGDSGYNEITRIEFSVIGDTSSTEYDIDINGASYESGSKLEFLDTDEIKVTISAEGSIGESWVGVYTNEMGIDTDFTDITSAYWQWIKDINGIILDLKQEMTLDYGDFSIVIFGDGGKSDPRKVVNFSIAQGENDSSIIKQPTCSNWGTRYVEYDDGTSAYVPIEPLGHDVQEWTYDKDRHSHSGICQRKNCGHELTRLCKFDDGVMIEQKPDGTGVILYTCSVCKGTYTEGYTEIPVDNTVVRIFGETRVETAMVVANRYKELLGVEKLDNIIIANGSNFADALAGTYLAKQKNAPILMYHGKNTDELHRYINENLKSAGTVYILGGLNVLPQELEHGLDGFYVKRLAGATRYETNIEILKEAGVTDQEILVCTGTSFADSLSASAVGKPILLVNNKTKKLSNVQKEYLSSISSDKFYIIGGENAVSENFEIALRTYGATERLGGATRYETSVEVAERFFDTPDNVVLAYSMNFPDGLCGGPLAMVMNAPLILTATNKTTVADAYIENNRISAGTVLGGVGLISDEAVTEIFNMNEDNQIEVIK